MKSYRIGNKFFVTENYHFSKTNIINLTLTGLITIVPPNVFVGLEMKYDFSKTDIFAICFILYILQVITISLFIHCWLKNPGILIQNPQLFLSEKLSENDRKSLSENTDATKLYYYKSANIQIPLRFCKTCKIFRPPRTHHCSVCDVCILNLDHHCPWISNCVGFKNRKDFIWLLFFGNCLSIMVLTLSLYKFIIEIKTRNIPNRLTYLGILIVISGIMVMGLFSMFLWQFYLIFKGINTYEYLRGAFSEEVKVLNKGCCSNISIFMKDNEEIATDHFDQLITRDYLVKRDLILHELNKNNSEKKKNLIVYLGSLDCELSNSDESMIYQNLVKNPQNYIDSPNKLENTGLNEIEAQKYDAI